MLTLKTIKITNLKKELLITSKLTEDTFIFSTDLIKSLTTPFFELFDSSNDLKSNYANSAAITASNFVSFIIGGK